TYRGMVAPGTAHRRGYPDPPRRPLAGPSEPDPPRPRPGCAPPGVPRRPDPRGGLPPPPNPPAPPPPPPPPPPPTPTTTLPLPPTPAAPARWGLPSTALPIGMLLLGRDHEPAPPPNRPVGGALIAGPVTLAAPMSGPALAATTGLAAGVLLPGSAAAG